MFRTTTPSASSTSRSCNPHSSPLSVHSAPAACSDLVEAAKFLPFFLATRHSFTLSPEGPLAPASLSPFPATLTDDLQLTGNPAALSPATATLTSQVTRNSCVCHSYKKHLGSHLSSQRSFRSGFSRPNFLPIRHSPLATKSFTIRTYEKCARNSLRIRTYKTQHLKPFRMNTYEKTGGGERLWLTRVG